MKIYLLIHYYTVLWLKYLHRVTTSVLDAVFPKKKRSLGELDAVRETALGGRELCEKLSALYIEHTGKAADRERGDIPSPTFFLPYQQPVVKRALWNFKYRQATDETTLLASIMYDECVAELSDRVTCIPFRHPAILVYAPSSMYAAGHKDADHMQLLAHAMEVLQNTKDAWWVLLDNAVEIRGHTTSADSPSEVSTIKNTTSTIVPQHELKKRDRLASAMYRYDMSVDTIHYLHTHPVSRVLCIDDITTTGATLAALSRTVSRVINNAVKRKKCTITCIALAH